MHRCSDSFRFLWKHEHHRKWFSVFKLYKVVSENFLSKPDRPGRNWLGFDGCLGLTANQLCNNHQILYALVKDEEERVLACSRTKAFKASLQGLKNLRNKFYYSRITPQTYSLLLAIRPIHTTSVPYKLMNMNGSPTNVDNHSTLYVYTYLFLSLIHISEPTRPY